MSSASHSKQAIVSPSYDGMWFVGPQFLGLILGIGLYGLGVLDLGLFGWLAVVVAIDVAHVYSTLFRTYCHADARRKHRHLLVAVPLFVLTIGIMAHGISPKFFWHAMAYLAVFHFIRQQFGFICLYRKPLSLGRKVEGTCIQLIPLLSVAYWHASGPKSFHWFLQGDFLYLNSSLVAQSILAMGVAAGVFLISWQIWAWRHGHFAPLSCLFTLGTALNWWMGIVVFDSDTVFTLSNVVAHGVPYVALMWIRHGRDGRTRQEREREMGQPQQARWPWLPVLGFLGVLLGLALVEETLWDLLVWRDYLSEFWGQGEGIATEKWLVWLVPLLAVPQVTHYVLDGLIWRRDFLE